MDIKKFTEMLWDDNFANYSRMESKYEEVFRTFCRP